MTSQVSSLSMVMRDMSGIVLTDDRSNIGRIAVNDQKPSPSLMGIDILQIL